jgi:hypothetical protein
MAKNISTTGTASTKSSSTNPTTSKGLLEELGGDKKPKKDKKTVSAVAITFREISVPSDNSFAQEKSSARKATTYFKETNTAYNTLLKEGKISAEVALMILKDGQMWSIKKGVMNNEKNLKWMKTNSIAFPNFKPNQERKLNAVKFDEFKAMMYALMSDDAEMTWSGLFQAEALNEMGVSLFQASLMVNNKYRSFRHSAWGFTQNDFDEQITMIHCSYKAAALLIKFHIRNKNFTFDKTSERFGLKDNTLIWEDGDNEDCENLTELINSTEFTYSSLVAQATCPDILKMSRNSSIKNPDHPQYLGNSRKLMQFTANILTLMEHQVNGSGKPCIANNTIFKKDSELNKKYRKLHKDYANLLRTVTFHGVRSSGGRKRGFDAIQDEYEGEEYL